MAFSIPAIIAVIFSCHNFATGFIDYYYAKITNEGNSLIIGTSRASQGIIPDSIMKGTQFEGPMINFAFSSFDSPFDEGYYNAIKKKLNEESKNSLFIIEIDPFALSSDEESNLISHKLKDQIIFNGNPNYEYLYRNVNPFYLLIQNRNFVDESSILHKNGWLELNLPMDTTSINTRAKAKLINLINTVKTCHISNEKFTYLEKIINLLGAHGKVILIKMPALQSIIEIENKYAKEIDLEVKKIASKTKVKYYDFTSNSREYSYVDGNHLDKKSAIKFSSELNKIILQNERTNIH
ncbi:MAG: hypothetical protein ACO3EE_00550 [Flavobacteriales bacterium]